MLLNENVRILFSCIGCWVTLLKMNIDIGPYLSINIDIYISRDEPTGRYGWIAYISLQKRETGDSRIKLDETGGKKITMDPIRSFLFTH